MLKSLPLSSELSFVISCLTQYKGLKYDAYFEVIVQTINKYKVTSALRWYKSHTKEQSVCGGQNKMNFPIVVSYIQSTDVSGMSFTLWQLFFLVVILLFVCEIFRSDTISRNLACSLSSTAV